MSNVTPNHLTEVRTESKINRNNIMISVKGVGKMYHLFNRPLDRLIYTLFKRFGVKRGEEFWALHNVSFDVSKGEVIGVVGRNGSGKSTLLQLVAGVIQPTAGTVEVKGRVSALLELGSGFNPEYTGRQNVYISGAILGLTKDEIESRFDDIFSFADIGHFIDQPVKVYSSGMFARLAFSVAIAVNPDVLVVDEILAVGDYGFQQKCVARMREMRDDGLTLLYVSHSTDSIIDICDKALFLHDGNPITWGKAPQVVDNYLKFMREEKWLSMPTLDAGSTSGDADSSISLRYGSGEVRISEVYTTNPKGQRVDSFYIDDMIHLHVNFKAVSAMSDLSVNFSIRDNNGITVMGTNLFDERVSFPDLQADEEGNVVFIFSNQLRHGNYGVTVSINKVTKRDYSDNVELDWIGSVHTFQVLFNPERPAWYKFHCPVEIVINQRSGTGSSPKNF